MSLESPNSVRGTFHNAHHFVVQHSKFINVKGNYIVSGNNDEGPGSGIASLRRMAVIGATYDGAERYPPPRCAAETRVEVLRQINRWIDNPRLNMLWLYGPAGAGKSAIAQTIAESAEERGCLAAGFFFARTSETRNTANNLFPTIAYQLALHFAEYRAKVDDVMRKDPDIAVNLVNLVFQDLDNPKLAPAHWRDNFLCLQTSATRGIFPPSLFVTNITCDTNEATWGAYADVYRGKLKHLPVCEKALRMVASSPKAKQDEIYKGFINEALVWRQLLHPNIVPFIGASTKMFLS